MSMIHSIDTSEYDGITELLWCSEFAGFFERKIDAQGRMWKRDYWSVDCNFDVPMNSPDYGCDTEYGEWEIEHSHEILDAWGNDSKDSYYLKFTDGFLVEIKRGAA